MATGTREALLDWLETPEAVDALVAVRMGEYVETASPSLLAEWRDHAGSLIDDFLKLIATSEDHVDSGEDVEALESAREFLRERPQASIHVSVKNGKARLVMPNAAVAFVREGEAIRVWPYYQWREEVA